MICKYDEKFPDFMPLQAIISRLALSGFSVYKKINALLFI